MVYWIYVLENDDDFIYVGQTKRLYRRFHEHMSGNGSVNTTKYPPTRLIGLYKAAANTSFYEYRNALIKKKEFDRFILERWADKDESCAELLIENQITERFFYERRGNSEYGSGAEWYKVRGGKYTWQSLDDILFNYELASENPNKVYSSANPIAKIPVQQIVDRPLCKCGNPCEVRLNRETSVVYFVCSLKNIWEDFFDCGLEVDSPCNFYQAYNEDKDVRQRFPIIKSRSKEQWVNKVPVSRYKINTDPCVSCERKGYLGIYNGEVRRLCQDCMYSRYEDMKSYYNLQKDVEPDNVVNKQVCLIED